MKKIALILLGLLLLSATVSAYQTVVTLTINNIDNPIQEILDSVAFHTSYTVEVDCQNPVPANITLSNCSGCCYLNVGNSFSFLCEVNSEQAYAVSITGEICTNPEHPLCPSFGGCVDKTVLFNFPFIAS